MLLSFNIKFFSTDDSICLKNNDFKSIKYEEKKKPEDNLYDTAKKDYCKRRGNVWKYSRLKQLEHMIKEHRIIYSEWKHDSLNTIILSSGVIAHLIIKSKTFDLTQVLFDKFYASKIPGQIVTNAVFSKNHALFMHSDKTANLITFGKKSQNFPALIADRDPHIQSIELKNCSRRTEHKVSWCDETSVLWILIWGSVSCQLTPWNPVQEDYANLHLYKVDGQKLQLIAYHYLKHDTLHADVSDGIVIIIEQICNQKNGVNLSWSQYNLRTDATSPTNLSSSQPDVSQVSLPVPVRAVHLMQCKKRIFVACIDSSLYVIHHVAGILHTTRAAFIGSTITCAGQLLIVAEDGGRLQCFDRALSPLHHHTTCLDLTSYLKNPNKMSLLATRALDCGSALFAKFSTGPLMLLYLQHPRLISSWIRANQIENAVLLLRAMDWGAEGPMCLWALQRLCKMAATREGLAHVEQALSAYFAPVVPHPPEADKYAAPVHDLARKFFHQLLRRGELEKALSLGVELRAWDLFVDARWAATARQLHALATDAAALAAAHAPAVHGSECSDSCSQCSSQSCTTQSGDDSSSTEETIPPPLPRVKLPHVPSLPSVHAPSVTIEHSHIKSRQANLCNYLERENILSIKVGNPVQGGSLSQHISSQSNIEYFQSYGFESDHIDHHGAYKTHAFTAKDRNLRTPNSNHRKIEKEVWQSVNHSSVDRDKSRQRNNFLSYPQWQHLEEIISNKSNWDSTMSSVLADSNLDMMPKSQTLIRNIPKASVNLKNYNDSSRTNVPRNTLELSTIPRSNMEKNKVKFSDTVQITLLSDCDMGATRSEVYIGNTVTEKQCNQTTELSESHTGSLSTENSEPENVPKIKVVHLGMV